MLPEHDTVEEDRYEIQGLEGGGLPGPHLRGGPRDEAPAHTALNEVPTTIHVIEGAPHHALFKHVSAVVHHGGAGTTAVGLWAELAALICSLAFDQPFWGRRVFSLGGGPKAEGFKRLRAERFTEGLIELT